MPSDATSSVKRARLARGMTLQELAEKCTEDGAKVGESQLSRIERGIHAPRPRLRVVLARALGLDPQEFELTGPVS